MTATLDLGVRRDLGATELWERSLARSQRRRARESPGEEARRSLVSVALSDLDGPVLRSPAAAGIPRKPRMSDQRPSCITPPTLNDAS